MNVAWKFIAVLALLFSLAALTLEIVRIQQKDADNDVKQEIAEQIAAREQTMVERVAPRINTVRADVDLPERKMQTFEDLTVAFVELVQPLSAKPHPKP